jgi:hypothetical protein
MQGSARSQPRMERRNGVEALRSVDFSEELRHLHSSGNMVCTRTNDDMTSA